MMNNILCNPPKERLVSTFGDSFGKKMRPDAEQKSVRWIIELFYKFYKAEKLVPNICTGALATGKQLLKLPEESRFVDCEKEVTVFSGYTAVASEGMLSEGAEITVGQC